MAVVFKRFLCQWEGGGRGKRDMGGGGGSVSVKWQMRRETFLETKKKNKKKDKRSGRHALTHINRSSANERRSEEAINAKHLKEQPKKKKSKRKKPKKNKKKGMHTYSGMSYLLAHKVPKIMARGN